MFIPADVLINCPHTHTLPSIPRCVCSLGDRSDEVPRLARPLIRTNARLYFIGRSSQVHRTVPVSAALPLQCIYLTHPAVMAANAKLLRSAL